MTVNVHSKNQSLANTPHGVDIESGKLEMCGVFG